MLPELYHELTSDQSVFLDVSLHCGGFEVLWDCLDDAVQEEFLLEFGVVDVQRAFIDIFEDFELVCEDGAFNIAVELSFSQSAFDNVLLHTQVLPVEYKEEEQNRNENSDQELEIVIPNIIDVWHDSFPQLSTLFGIFSLEEFKDILVSK